VHAAPDGGMVPERPAGAQPPGSGGLLLAADVGNSKTDVALLRTDGSVVAAVRGSTASHERVGFDAAVRVLLDLVARAGAVVSGRRTAPTADLAVVCAAGIDFPREERRLGRLLEQQRLASRVLVRNDTYAALRAGADGGWGVAVVCGAGINCVARAPDGRDVRFPALGEISGDWGGGQALGAAALWAAVRARDGRGPRTLLEHRVPAHFGLRRPIDVTLAIHRGRLAEERLGELAPDVFSAAATDAVARAIVDRLADEIVAMAAAAIRRAHLVRRDPPVVLAGGVFNTGDDAFHARIRDGLAAQAPGARIRRVEAPPVLGAALLALDAAGSDEAAARVLRAGLADVPRDGLADALGAGQAIRRGGRGRR
jgi:N-acetylglucosamine kinase-like BadF-type ATPase